MYSKIEGQPMRVKDGTADSINEALKVLGIKPVCKQTPAAITVNGTRVAALKAYNTKKSIEADNKVSTALRDLLKESGIDTQTVYDAHKFLDEEFYKISWTPRLGSMGEMVTEERVRKMLEAAEAVKALYEQHKELIAQHDALCTIFNRQYFEICR